MQIDDMEDARRPQRTLTARDAGLIGCRRCGRVHGRRATVCLRCGGTLFSRDKRSLQRVWAWLIAGLIAYIPANLYPMLLTSTFGQTTSNTIVGGVIELVHYGEYGIAAIVFGASVMIPIGKFIAIAYLAISVQRASTLSGHARQRLYEVVEFIGRWSMIDVFVVAILSALVQLNFVAQIHPGIAAICFALSVAFTMISAQSFDPKTIWDAGEATDT